MTGYLLPQNKTLSGFAAFLAPAKLNLFLHITGKRSDGYHLLQTLFRLIDVYDTVYLKTRSDGVIRRANTVDTVAASDDLCLRAAYLLQTYTGTHSGVDIALDKRIPIGSGLGGGSSNAATVLLALNRLWELNLSRQTLMHLGGQLGADVPIFIHGTTAWAEGVGDILTTVHLPRTFYVVITPNVLAHTGRVFADFHLTTPAKPLKMRALLCAKPHAYSSVQARLTALGASNQLEHLTCALYPEVADTLRWMRKFGDAKMSGTGASVFLEVEDLQSAEVICEQRPNNTWGVSATSLVSHPLYDYCTM